MMSKTVLLLGFLFFSFAAVSQKSGDKKIIISFSDTVTYQKVKIALAKHDFAIREDGRQDTITTLLREFKTMPGYCTLTAIIKNNSVVLSGNYGRKKVNVLGYNTMPKDYRPILYFSGSKSWRLLMSVAQEMGGTLTFSN